MKSNFYVSLVLSLVCLCVQAQNTTPEALNPADNAVVLPPTDSLTLKKEKPYNLWSVNVNLGTHVGIRPYTDGYHSTTPNYFKNPNLQHVDFNVRKMFNTKFGLALDVSYDRFTADAGSPDFDNNFFRTSLRGVMNMHRVMNWEEFTDTFGMQLHSFTVGFSFGSHDDDISINSIC